MVDNYRRLVIKSVRQFPDRIILHFYDFIVSFDLSTDTLQKANIQPSDFTDGRSIFVVSREDPNNDESAFLGFDSIKALYLPIESKEVNF